MNCMEGTNWSAGVRFTGRGDGQRHASAQTAQFFFREIFFGAKIFHFASDATGQFFGIEARDRGDAARAVAASLPKGTDPDADGADHS
jgi:hypothetical protein